MKSERSRERSQPRRVDEAWLGASLNVLGPNEEILTTPGDEPREGELVYVTTADGELEELIALEVSCEGVWWARALELKHDDVERFARLRREEAGRESAAWNERHASVEPVEEDINAVWLMTRRGRSLLAARGSVEVEGAVVCIGTQGIVFETAERAQAFAGEIEQALSEEVA